MTNVRPSSLAITGRWDQRVCMACPAGATDCRLSREATLRLALQTHGRGRFLSARPEGVPRAMQGGLQRESFSDCFPCFSFCVSAGAQAACASFWPAGSEALGRELRQKRVQINKSAFGHVCPILVYVCMSAPRCFRSLQYLTQLNSQDLFVAKHA